MTLLKDKKFNESGENAAKTILKKKLDDIIDILSKYSWEVGTNKIAMLLSSIFYPDYTIRFVPTKIDSKENLIDLSGLYPNGDIELYVHPSLSEYFREFRSRENWAQLWKDYDENQFIREFISETAHMLYFRKNKLEKFENHIGIMPMMKIQYYLKMNADVYVLEAIDEVEETGGVSNMLGIYKEFFGSKSKVYKEFLAKVREKSSVKDIKGVF